MGKGNAIFAWQYKDVNYMWGKMQYPHYNPNPHNIWERETQYLHDNITMQTICGDKMQYSHYDPNPHYILEKEMKYLNNNLKMQTICVWQNAILALWP
jgi:hypothetical protein